MAKQSPPLYSLSKTFMWFAVVSLLLTASLAGIIYTDYNREWKTWQKKFFKLKEDGLRAELKTADASVDKKKLAELEKIVADAKASVSAKRAEFEAVQKELAALNTKIVKARTDYQELKQFHDSYKYFFEEHRLHGDTGHANEYGKKLDEIRPKLNTAKLALEELEKANEEKEAAAASFTAAQKEAQRALDKHLDERTRIFRRLEKAKPSIAKDILNAPMLDFVAPSIKIQQVVLEKLQDDYHFAKVQKVDRCTTCHLGIDQKGFENAPQPFRTHPNLDLYLGSSSPHGIETFGCTSCHSGNGHSVSFKDSAHTPRSEEQAKEWAKKYDWKTLDKWENKMLPMQHVQAACTKCHSGVINVPQADKLNRGRALAEQTGCYNCHKIAGFENRWKAGPSLERVGSKVDQDWLVRWLQNPKDFRESTKMPRVFHLSNTSSPEDIDRGNAAIQSITAYLLKNSESVSLQAPTAKGDAARGEELVKTIGCTGCHSVAGVNLNHHGPELAGLGSKLGEDWLFNWLKNPKGHSTETRMPNMRLSDQEAADITAYLLSVKNDTFDQKPVPAAKPEVINAMILDSLEGAMRRSEAEAKLEKMSAEERLLFLGKKTILHQGCYNCHSIKGFEDAKPIGTELSNWGAKDIHQIDFAFVEIPHTREAFFTQKMKDPRIFDKGKERPYYEKLRMPKFNLSDEDIDALTTFVLSLRHESVPLEMQKLADVETEKGRLLVAKFNCNGCHTLDGKTGVLRENAEDLGAAPPAIEGEGAKVQERWLYEFLHSPSTIRPWLKYRMPTFGFSDEELHALVNYFNLISGTEPSFSTFDPHVSSTPDKMHSGKELVAKLQCVKCHEVNPQSAALGTSFLAPDLTMTKNRLKPEWVRGWVSDPQKLEAGTMMPTFFTEGEDSPIADVLDGNAAAQIEAIRDYLYAYEKPQDSSEKQASS